MGRPDFTDNQPELEGSGSNRFTLHQIFNVEGSLRLDVLQEPAAPWTRGMEYLLDSMEEDDYDEEEPGDDTRAEADVTGGVEQEDDDFEIL